MVRIISDNVSTDKSLLTRAGIPLIGCAIRRFNISIQAALNNDEQLMSKINKFIRKLRELLLVAGIRRFTPLRQEEIELDIRNDSKLCDYGKFIKI